MTHNTFNFKSIMDFDKHIALSIPNYDGLLDIVKAVFLEYMPPQGTCSDIGCSTGKVLNMLSGLVAGSYRGVDLVDFNTYKNYQLFIMDGVKYLENLQEQDIIICMFTLQFLAKDHRWKAIKELERLVSRGSTLILAEKIYRDSVRINSVLQKEHTRQKRQHFTDKEILDKEHELTGSMFCKTSSEITKEINFIGRSEQIWQSYNFCAWTIVKKGEV